MKKTCLSLGIIISGLIGSAHATASDSRGHPKLYANQYQEIAAFLDGEDLGSLALCSKSAYAGCKRNPEILKIRIRMPDGGVTEREKKSAVAKYKLGQHERNVRQSERATLLLIPGGYTWLRYRDLSQAPRRRVSDGQRCFAYVMSPVVVSYDLLTAPLRLMMPFLWQSAIGDRKSENILNIYAEVAKIESFSSLELYCYFQNQDKSSLSRLIKSVNKSSLKLNKDEMTPAELIVGLKNKVRSGNHGVLTSYDQLKEEFIQSDR